MRLMRAEHMRPPAADAMLCRASRLIATLTLVVMIAIAVSLWIWATRSETRLFQISAIFVSVICVPAAAYNLAQTLKTGNWLMRFDDDGVAIRFRSWRRGSAPGERPEVVDIPWEEVIDVRPVREVIRERRSGQRTSRWTRRSLEIRLRGDDVDALGLAVMEDATASKAARGPGIRISSSHRPVRWIDDGVIAVTFRGKYDAVTPRLGRVVERMRAHTAVLPERDFDAGFVRDMSGDDFERHLVALVDGGDTLAAVQAVCERVGCGLTEARETVRGIADRGRSDCADRAP